MWFAVWPGVVTASMVKPLPATTSPSASARSGRNSVSLLASRRGASPIFEGTRGAVRSFGQNQGPGRRLDPGDRGGMIAVSVRHENMGDGFTAHGVEQGGDVRLVERPGIDDRDLAAADDVGHRSFEREWSGVVGEYPPHARRGLRHGFGRQVEAPVEGNVVAHVDRP